MDARTTLVAPNRPRHSGDAGNGRGALQEHSRAARLERRLYAPPRCAQDDLRGADPRAALFGGIGRPGRAGDRRSPGRVARQARRAGYLTPQHLQTSPKLGGRCLLIGACLLDPWTDILSVTHPEWAVEVVTFNNVDGLPPRSAQDMGRIDFQILQIPMRFVLPDHVYFGMLAGSQREEMVWDDCVERVRLAFHALTEYARTFSTPAFMLSLLTPQRHSLGRFGDTGSRAEPVGLVRALNDEIARLCSAAGSVFFYDFEQTISLYGKKYFQDDIASHSNHGGLLGSIDIFPQMDRLHPLGDAVALYGPRHTPHRRRGIRRHRRRLPSLAANRRCEAGGVRS